MNDNVQRYPTTGHSPLTPKQIQIIENEYYVGTSLNTIIMLIEIQSSRPLPCFLIG
jgi:hypothetical protein